MIPWIVHLYRTVDVAAQPARNLSLRNGDWAHNIFSVLLNSFLERSF